MDLLQCNFLRGQINGKIRSVLFNLPYPASARFEENLAVFISAEILAHHFTTAGIKDIRQTSVLVAADYFGITKEAVQDMISRQIGLSITDYDKMLGEAIMKNNRIRLKKALINACTDCCQLGDAYIANNCI